MEPIGLLKKLKRLEPNPDYSRKSKVIILSQRQGPVFSFSLREVAIGVLRSGWSMALTAVFLFLVIGGFSVLKIISPATTAVIDITGLKAEAQAIDAQIQLTNVNYEELSIENKTSTVGMIIRKAKKAAAEANQAAATEANVLTTDEIIGSALDELSK